MYNCGDVILTFSLYVLVGVRSTNGSYTSRDQLMQGDNSDNRTNRSFQNKRKIQLDFGDWLKRSSCMLWLQLGCPLRTIQQFAPVGTHLPSMNELHSCIGEISSENQGGLRPP